MGIELIHVDAGDRFFDRLAGVTDPEAKRKAIGELVHPHLRGAHRRPDRGRVPRAGHALPRPHRERRHRRHGRGDQEPPQRRRSARRHDASSSSSRCATCSRTRCAASASSSGCPTRWCGASRSPGPGLGVRIIGEVTPERVALLQEADAIVRDEIAAAGLRARDLAVVRRARRHPLGRRDGRRAHVRPPDHHPRRHERRRDDRRLGPPAVRPAREDVEPHHQRGAPASTGSPTTSRRSRRARSSGSDGRTVDVVRTCT